MLLADTRLLKTSNEPTNTEETLQIPHISSCACAQVASSLTHLSIRSTHDPLDDKSIPALTNGGYSITALLTHSYSRLLSRYFVSFLCLSLVFAALLVLHARPVAFARQLCAAGQPE